MLSRNIYYKLIVLVYNIIYKWIDYYTEMCLKKEG